MATEYKLIHSTHHETFEQDVTQHLADGWVLIGGVSTAVAIHYDNTFEWTWSQAMTKTTK